MAVDLGDLVEALKPALNVPGETGFFTIDGQEDAWTKALGNGFWWAWLRGFFKSYRVVDDDDTIVNVTDGGPDLDRGLQQVIVVFTAMQAIEAKLITMTTSSTSTAGPVSVERERSANLLIGLMNDRRRELEQTRQFLLYGIEPGQAIKTTVQVIDAVLARDSSPFWNPNAGTGYPWMR